MKLVVSYTMRHVWRALLQVVIALAAVQFFLGLIAELGMLNEANYRVGDLLLYVLMNLPFQSYQLLPVVSVLAGLLALGRMAKNSELIAMRAVGFSTWRIGGVVVLAACLASLVLAFVGEGVGPYLADRAYTMKQACLKAAPEYQAAFWLKEKHALIRVGHVRDGHLQDYTRYRFGPDANHFSVEYAKKGIEKKGQWILDGVRRVQFTPEKATLAKPGKVRLRARLHPHVLNVSVNDSQRQSIWQLMAAIRAQKKVGLNTQSLVFSVWQRFMQPVTMVVLLTMAVPFVFGSLRDSSMGFRAMVGLMLAFLYYMLNQFIGPFSVIYRIPPVYAALAPPLLMLCLFMGLMLQQRIKR